MVGTPINIQFDIGKASLKVTIRVTATDVAQLDEKDEAFVSSSKKAQDEEYSLPTEIFLPLIHFASDECVRQSLIPFGEHEQQFDSDEELGAGSDTSGMSTPSPYTASTATLPLTISPKSDKGDSTVIQTKAYDFGVKVSEGRVELYECEQTLRWFYAVPSGEEKEKEVSIEITRSGGAIKWAKSTRGASSARKVREGCAGWLEESWCSEACSIM
jgi:hypothetical protein